MNTILTIDTSSSNCAVALLHSTVLTQRVSEAQRQSAQRVLPMISELLLEAKLSLSDVELLAVVAGPGSFTGVRIGVAVAQGLSMSSGVDVVPLSSLALQAMAALTEQPADLVLVSEEARDGELYFGAYQRSDAMGVEIIGREQVALIKDLDQLPNELLSRNCCLAGGGWARQDEILKHLGCTADSAPQEHAIDCRLVAELAALRSNCGEAVGAALLRPNYIKEQLDYK